MIVPFAEDFDFDFSFVFSFDFSLVSSKNINL